MRKEMRTLIQMKKKSDLLLYIYIYKRYCLLFSDKGTASIKLNKLKGEKKKAGVDDRFFRSLKNFFFFKSNRGSKCDL